MESAPNRMLLERIRETKDSIAALQQQVNKYDDLADTLKELPDRLQHTVMVPMGKRAMMPGKIVRSNEILAHLGDEYFAWESASRSIAIVDRKKETLTKAIKLQQESLDSISSTQTESNELLNAKKMYEAEGIREITESEEESNKMAVSRATQDDMNEYFEMEEEERKKQEKTAWDWDDVMRRMEALEAAEERGENEPSIEEESKGHVSAEAQATKLKADGNSAFAKHQYSRAVELYTQAIAFDASSHILFGNRAAAYQRLKEYSKALKDASEAVKLKDDWVKGHYRRAGALASLGRYKEAADAYERAHSLNPSDNKLSNLALEMRAKVVPPTAQQPQQQSCPTPPSASSFASVTEATSDLPTNTSSFASKPLSSSTAAFSGSIMEKEIQEKAPPSVEPSNDSTRPTSRFLGTSRSGESLSLEPVGEAEPVQRVSRFKAARAARKN